MDKFLNKTVQVEEMSDTTEETVDVDEFKNVEDNGQYRSELKDERGDSLDEEPLTENNLEMKARRATRLEMIKQNKENGEKWQSKSKITALKDKYSVKLLRELKKGELKKEKKEKDKKEKKPKKEDNVNKLSLDNILNQIMMMKDKENKIFITIEKGDKKVRFEIM